MSLIKLKESLEGLASTETGKSLPHMCKKIDEAQRIIDANADNAKMTKQTKRELILLIDGIETDIAHYNSNPVKYKPNLDKIINEQNNNLNELHKLIIDAEIELKRVNDEIDKATIKTEKRNKWDALLEYIIKLKWFKD